MNANRLLVVLCTYFAVLLGSATAIGIAYPEALHYLPLGGNDVMETVGIDYQESSMLESLGITDRDFDGPVSPRQVGLLGVFLGLGLAGTVLVMLPITWTYSAIKWDIGYRKSFARALIVLPICAATTVLLIQNNLALAFGLAAMVAAVRFRVALQEAIDGIFIFAAICVGLAAGIGHLGIATIMAFVFCIANTVLWKVDYGRNPLDDLRVSEKRAKLERKRRAGEQLR